MTATRSVRVSFTNLHIDGQVRPLREHQLLLRIVANLEVWAKVTLVYKEIDFTVVELAYALSQWLKDTSRDFEFKSMEHECPALIYFRKSGNWWNVGTEANTATNASHIEAPALVEAATDFISKVQLGCRAIGCPIEDLLKKDHL